MATRKRVKKQTLAEFRAWLSGVEELQPDDWAPTAEQWQLIRAKIDGIAEPKPVSQPALVQPATVSNAPTNNAYQQPHLAQAHIPPPPPPAGGIPQGQITPPTAEAAVMLPPQQQVDVAAAAKPNLDTSDGNYDSSFS